MNTVCYLGGLALICCIGIAVAHYPMLATGYGGYMPQMSGSAGFGSGLLGGGVSGGSGMGGIGGMFGMVIQVFIFILVINLLTGTIGGLTGSSGGLLGGSGSSRVSEY